MLPGVRRCYIFTIDSVDWGQMAGCVSCDGLDGLGNCMPISNVRIVLGNYFGSVYCRCFGFLLDFPMG